MELKCGVNIQATASADGDVYVRQQRSAAQHSAAQQAESMHSTPTQEGQGHSQQQLIFKVDYDRSRAKSCLMKKQKATRARFVNSRRKKLSQKLFCHITSKWKA